MGQAKQVLGVLRHRGSWLSLAVGALAAGCSTGNDSTGPTPSFAVSAPRQQAPLYYHGTEAIPLVENPAQVVVELDAGDAAELARGQGITVTDDVGVSQAPGHRILRVNTGSGVAARTLRALPATRFAAPLYSAAQGGALVLLINSFDLKFTVDAEARATTILDSLGLETIRSPDPDSGYTTFRLRYPRAVDPLEYLESLRTRDFVEWISPGFISDWRIHSVPSDPYFSAQWHFENASTLNGIPIDINVSPVWGTTLGTKSIRVTVIDDGVHWLQQDLFNVLGGGSAIDLRTDDDPSLGEGGYDPFNNDTHGTSVAGIIGATHNNGLGGVGIAPNVTINSARIFRGTYGGEGGELNPFDPPSNQQIADAISWAWASTQSDVINNSWGGGSPNSQVTNAINAAVTSGRGGKGAVVVFSVGNDASVVRYPATLPNVIAVSAIAPSGTLALYSNRGPEVDIAAFGGAATGSCIGAIVTTDLWGAKGCNDGPGGDINFTTTFSGTSAAAPMVSGAAALLLSLEPGLTHSAVKSRLFGAADPWGDATLYGAGKLNVARTIFGPVLPAIAGPSTITGTFQSWTASASGGLSPYTFVWERADFCSGAWVTVGTGSSYGEVTTMGQPFWLRVTASSAARYSGLVTKLVGGFGTC